MAMTGGSGARIQMMQQQADSVTIVASPVSGTKYEWRTGETGAGAALGTQKNVRIISMAMIITWATTQPTPMNAIVTIDSVPVTFVCINPVTATYYGCVNKESSAENDQDGKAAINSITPYRAFLREGRSVKIEIQITWATTQPTNLTLRVKWQKIP